MLNPSYLIKSRHSIYYFRYPIPTKALENRYRVSISLKTRCPKEALQLAKILEYHSLNLTKNMDLKQMNHSEIMSIFKDHYTEVLERCKQTIDTNGPLPQENINNIKRHLVQLEELIHDDSDDIYEKLGIDIKHPEENPTHKDLQAIMEKYRLDFPTESVEYKAMKSALKYVQRNHFNDLLSYNRQVMDYTLLNPTVQANIKHTPDTQLSKIIENYLNEIKPNMRNRAFDEQRDCLRYLTDALGNDYPISKIGNTQVQKIKSLLIETPKNRNKSQNTKGRPLLEQISISKDNNSPVLGSTSVNKYLNYFSSLFGWAHQNNYINDNPFKGIRVKAKKKKHTRRDHFKKDEVKKIVKHLGNSEKTDLVKHTTYYWGALIAIYTGARRNEIASLLPDDIKKEKDSNIWYFDITDEEESKQIKTDAAKRIVPIHSRLIELGFIEYVEEARKVIAERPKTNGHPTRLLYDLTYTDHEKWGRKLGRWFNEKYLNKLELKTDKKTLHSLRHSFITNLSAAGVEGSHIKAMVGHEANTVTDQTYTHFDIEHLPVFKEAIEMLEY